MVLYNHKGFTFYSVRHYEWALGGSVHLDSSAFIDERRNPERRGKYFDVTYQVSNSVPRRSNNAD
jgi:hypothetical protein